MALGWSATSCTPANPADPLGPGPHPVPGATGGRDRWARVPAAFNHRVTSETSTAALEVLSGQMPADLSGHVFFQSLSLGPDDAGFSGDGLIWRVDLGGEKK